MKKVFLNLNKTATRFVLCFTFLAAMTLICGCEKDDDKDEDGYRSPSTSTTMNEDFVNPLNQL